MFSATSKFDPDSTNCTPEQLEIFSPVHHCDDIEEIITIVHDSEINTANTLSGPEFNVSSGLFTDLSKTKLFLKLQFLYENDSVIEVDDPSCPINNLSKCLKFYCFFKICKDVE